MPQRGSMARRLGLRRRAAVVSFDLGRWSALPRVLTTAQPHRTAGSTGHQLAIADIAAYAHLTQTDIEALGYELDAIRSDIEESLGERDAAYIRRTIKFQRTLDVWRRACSSAAAGHGSAGRWAPRRWPSPKASRTWRSATTSCHGQWDWMNDPEIHSSTWEWDMVGVSSQWRYSHNYRHHVFSNVLGMDDDLGFGVMRVTRDEPWRAAASAAAASESVVGEHIRMGHRPARRSSRSGFGPAQPPKRVVQARRADRKDRPPGRQGLRDLPGVELDLAGAEPWRPMRWPTCCATSGHTW